MTKSPEARACVNESLPVRLNRLAFVAVPREGARPEVQLVYLHGLGGSLANWYFDYLLPFRGRFHQLAYDLRGHGDSDCPLSGYTVGDHADDLHALVAAEAGTAARRCFIGYSYGGCVVLEYAVRYARASDCILIIDSPPVSRIDSAVVADLAGLTAAMHGQAAAARGQLAIEFTAAMGEGGGSRRSVSRYANRLKRLLDTRFPTEAIDNQVPDIAALATIPCPMLLVYAGQGDCIFHAKYIVANTRDARLLILDAKHDLVSTHAKDVRALIMEFFQS